MCALGIGAAACDGEDATPEAVGRDAYSLVLAEFLPTPAVSPDADRPIVFVSRLGDEPFALDDQVAMIDEFAESHDLRFVDSLDAAVDLEDPAAPARDGGVLLGIGTVAARSPHVVRVEVYAGAADVRAHLLTLEIRSDRWVIDTDESVEPEVLVGDE